MAGDGTIVVERVTKTFRVRNKPLTALEDVSLSVSSGEVVGLLGPNGAGKTTLLRCVCGLVIPDFGAIRLGDIDVVRHPIQAPRTIATVFESSFRATAWRLTPLENLELFAAYKGIPARACRTRAHELVERFGLTDKAKTQARMLSRGQQQRLAIACALIQTTPIVLLDEPTLGLDVETSRQFRGYLRELVDHGQRGLLITSHDMDVVQEVCPRIIIVNQGRVVADDTLDNLLAVFRTRRFRFSTEEPVSDAVARAVRSSFSDADIRSSSDGGEITVELAVGADFFKLVDCLRDADVTVVSVNTDAPDLEQVFLRLVGAH